MGVGSVDLAFWQHLKEFMMKPLPQWCILSSQLNNFLGNNSPPERTNRRDLSLRKQRHIIDQLLIKLLNLKLESFLINFIRLPFFSKFQQLLTIFLIQILWKSSMFAPEIQDPVEDYVELFGIAEFLPCADWHLFGLWGVWVRETFLEGVEFLVGWDFHLCGQASGKVWAELGCISNGEAIRRSDSNLILPPINLLHSLNFPKSNSIPITKPMLLLIMQIYDTNLILSNTSNMNSFLLLTIGVDNFMIFPKINKGKTIQSQVAGVQEPDVVLSAGLV